MQRSSPCPITGNGASEAPRSYWTTLPAMKKTTHAMRGRRCYPFSLNLSLKLIDGREGGRRRRGRGWRCERNEKGETLGTQARFIGGSGANGVLAFVSTVAHSLSPLSEEKGTTLDEQVAVRNEMNGGWASVQYGPRGGKGLAHIGLSLSL